MNPSSRFACLAPLVAALGSFAPSALANGRFPAADQLIIDPSDPMHIVVRTTFGFVETRDGGKEWLWTCEEEIIGRIANQDPPFAVTGDGTVVVAVPFEGVSITHDHGCSWSRAPAPLTGQLAVDVTLEPDDPASILVLTSTNDSNPDAGPNAPPEFLNLVVETKDHGATWGLRGVPLARDFIAATIEIAHSDPNRIYASGVFGEPLRGAIERSEDGGKSWTRALVPTGDNLGSVYISAIDANDADHLFVRVLDQPQIATNATPTVLLASRDKGNTWNEIARTDEGMLGFALSPDGTKLAYGTLGQGVFIGPADNSAPLTKVSGVPNRCLTWSAAGLYACSTDLGRGEPGMTPPPTFAVGLSHDTGSSYDTLYKLFQTCPTVCPADSRFNQLCRMTWQTIPGVTTATGATGETCSVEWAKTAVPDAGKGAGGSGGNGGAGGTAGAGGGGVDKDAGGGGSVDPPMGDDCGCRLAAQRHGPSLGAGAFGLAAILGYARRRRRRGQREG